MGFIRGRELLEVFDTFFKNFRGAGIIRGGTLLEVIPIIRYLKLPKVAQSYLKLDLKILSAKSKLTKAT